MTLVILAQLLLSGRSAKPADTPAAVTTLPSRTKRTPSSTVASPRAFFTFTAGAPPSLPWLFKGWLVQKAI